MKHLKQNGIGYIPHMLFSFSLACKGLRIFTASSIHGIFPFLFTNNSSNLITAAHKKVHQEIVDKQRRLAYLSVKR